MSSSLDSLFNNLASGGSKFFGFEDYNDSSDLRQGSPH